MARRTHDFWYRFAAMLLRPLMVVLTKRDWAGGEHLPGDRGFVVVVNHVSYLDPISVAHYLHDHGHPPRFLAKAVLLRLPVIGRILRGAGQIPVHRETRDAGLALRDACAAVEQGECVVVYPEGTVTRDPGLWPMTGKTGAARIAFMTGAPVIPIAQWGPQEVLAPYSKRFRFFPRKTMRVVAGPPVDLSDLAGRGESMEVLREATARIIDAVTTLLEKTRDEQAPPERFDMRTMHVPTTGNPYKKRRGDRESA